MAGEQGYPRRVNEPAPHRRPRYPGGQLETGDASVKARREAPRCHIFPPKKGTRVMTQGVFDLVHLGHLHYLQAARAHGDELIVVIARDETVKRNKHAPIFNEEARRELVNAMKCVDSAVLGHRGDFYRIVEEIDPDIICIGYDQPYKEHAIQEECARRGLDVRVERLPHMDYDLDSTRKVVEEVGRRLARHELYRSGPQSDQKSLRDVGVDLKEQSETGTSRTDAGTPEDLNRSPQQQDPEPEHGAPPTPATARTQGGRRA